MANPICLGHAGFDCSIMFLIPIALFFVAAIARKQLADLMDIDFNIIGGTVGAVVPFFVIELITKSHKWSLLIGIVGLIIGGFLLGKIFGGGEGGDYSYG